MKSRGILPLGVAVAVVFTACGGSQKQETTPENNLGQAQQEPAQAGGEPASAGEQMPEQAQPAAQPRPAAAPALPAAAPSAAVPTAEVRKAMALVRRGQYEQAIAEARRALRRNEKFVPAMVVMARAYYHLGKLEFAEFVCVATALKIKPNTGECYNLLGHVALKRENHTLALKNFEKATKVQPSLGPAWLNYGAMLLKVKNYSAAVPALERASQLLPRRAELWLNLGVAYRGNGNLGKARQALLKALGFRARYAAAYFNMGLLYLDAQKVFDGKTRLQQLAEATAYFNRYKQTGAFAKDDPVNEYIEAAQKLGKREIRDIERRKKKKARDAARKAADAQKAAQGAAKKAAPKK